MQIHWRSILGEMATAVAVLALYVLVLLAPLHQAAGLQRSLALLGFESIYSWSVCASVEAPGDSDVPTAVKCPIAGVAKLAFAGPLPEAPVLHDPRQALHISVQDRPDAPLAKTPGKTGQPRGPPASA